MSIPLNNIVKINPGVLDVGNNGNNLFGLMLTKAEGLPAGQISSFTSADYVGKIFGKTSKEYELASVYFSGFTNSDRVAEQLYIAPYYSTSTPASLVGGSLEKVTLKKLREFSGDLTVQIISNNQENNFSKTVKTIDLGRVKSFSEAASILNTAIFGIDVAENSNESPKGSITFSSSDNSVMITSTQSKDKIVASGTLAEQLNLAGVNSVEGSDELTLTELLDTLRSQNLSFCSVFFVWDTSEDEKEKLAQWADSMRDDVCVILNDTDREKRATNNNTLTALDTAYGDLSFAEKVNKRGYESVVCVYNNLELCAFIAGYPAAWDLTKTDGRFTAAFRRNTLLTANVTDESQALTLKAKGYNFYGSWASSTSNFTFMYEGRISGQYLWLDSWFCQVWMRRQFQYYFVLTLLAKGQIPYNTDGKGILTTAIKPAIDQYLNFGAIRPGISLSDAQIQELKQAGLTLAQINNITSVGYYLRVDMERVTPQTRVQRGSPPIDFWYTDGQSVQQINMNSIEIQ